MAQSNKKTYEIRGTVTGEKQSPLQNARVVVWRKQIRERTELAAGSTSVHGNYVLRYEVGAAEKQPFLIYVEALSEYLDRPLYSPPTRAQQTLEINLSYETPDQSEWTELIRSLDPLLDGLKLSELVEDRAQQDITFLSSNLNVSAESIMRVAVSARLEAAFRIPAPVFYAFLRQGVPSGLPSPLFDKTQSFGLSAPLTQNVASLIFALSPQTQTQTLTSAIALDQIGQQYTGQISQIVAALQSNRTTDLLNQPYLTGNATLAQLLGVIGLSQTQQQAFAQALATNTQPMSAFWSTLGDSQHGFTAAEASSIALTLSIGAFVNNFLPLVQNLSAGFTSGAYQTLPDLAHLSLQDWQQLVNTAGAPPGVVATSSQSAAEIFAGLVYGRVTSAYPTAALSSRIANLTALPADQQQPLIQFFANNPGLELITDNVPAYLAAQGNQAFTEIAAADQLGVVTNVRIFQRVLRVARNPDVAQILLTIGIKSATDIVTLGQRQFFNQATAAGLAGPDATQAFESASQRYASTVSLYMQLNLDSLGIWPKAMGSPSDLSTAMAVAVRQDPTLATLFGSQDYCATDDCTSILSPAAYLCDLLRWLSGRQQGAQTALDVLDARRPDIRHLLLNCPNTDTELPYIDLVIELLADKISPPLAASTTLALPLTLADSAITVMDDDEFPFPKFYISIGPEILLVTLVGASGNTFWNVTRAQLGTNPTTAPIGAAVTLYSPTNPQWKQTSASLTQVQLSAAPEYFNQDAFVKLSNAEYPQSLPYSTGLDGLRTYLQQWNLPLWQLRQALLPLTGATISQQAAVAIERFGISSNAGDLIANQTADPAIAWNTAAPPNDLVPITQFLQAASLTYEQLLELLEVAWVQGGLNVSIQGIDDTCNTGNQSLTPAPLDAGFLDRAHRFIRLWLATGYKMWELDLLLGLLLNAPFPPPGVANGTLDESGLVALFFFRQLQDAIGLSVDQLLAFYQNIDTAAHRDPDGNTTTPFYSQIFLNPIVTWVAPDPDLANLPTGGAVADPLLTDHLPAIQPALGVSSTDATTLIGLTDNQLTLGNLSLMYRVNALAAASKFSISDLLSTASLLNPAAANSAAAVAPLLSSPAATLAFLTQATNIRQSGLSLDALTYLFTPPSATLSGGWATSTQMTQSDITVALGTVQQVVVNLSSAATTLTAEMLETDNSITVAGDVGFPSSNFYVYIGSEILLVTAVGGSGGTTWSVVRAQQGTAKVSAPSGTPVTPTSGDLDGVVIAAVAANAHSAGGSGLANDVTSLILSNLQVPGGGKTLLQVLEDPALVAAGTPAAIITVGGTPAAGDSLQTVLTDTSGNTCTVLYPLAANDIGNINQTALDFAQAIDTSAAVAGPNAFLAACTVSGPVITLSALTPGAAAGSITAANAALPGGLNHVSSTPANAALSPLPVITQAGFPNQFLAIQLFDKIGVLVRAFRLVAADFLWLLTDANVYGGLDFTQLPMTGAQPALSLPPLLTTLQLIKLARLFTAAPLSSQVRTLYDVISGVSSGTLATEAQAQSAVATVTGWPLADIQSFAPALGVAFPGSYTQPAVYTALQTLEAMTNKVVASGAQLASWGGALTDEIAVQTSAADALGVLIAQQPSSDAWLMLAPNLMNPIRARRSAALQAYLLAQRSGGSLVYPDTNHLFDYFLIDVQISSCLLTSRMVQTYIAVQIFVERCLMNLEADVVADPTLDCGWSQWQWMDRYRIWEANREVFCYPENWLIESERPNRTEIYQKFEQEVRQGQSTADYLETVVLNYIDRLDGLAHLLVTGTCEDSAGAIHVVARTLADPPTFYLRTFEGGAWSGWSQITLDIKAYQVIPITYRGRICLFWLDVKVSTEPQQQLPAAQASANPPSQEVERYVSIGVYFSIFRNGSWAPAQASKGKLFDKPMLTSRQVSDTKAVEFLYTLKVQPPEQQTPPPAPGFGANYWLDVFRFGDYSINNGVSTLLQEYSSLEDKDGTLSAANQAKFATDEINSLAPQAIHVGRATFDGRFSDLELADQPIIVQGEGQSLYFHSMSTYGPDAQQLLLLDDPESDLVGESVLEPQAGALVAYPGSPSVTGDNVTELSLTPPPTMGQAPWIVLNSAAVPLRIVTPVTDLSFNPSSYFFYQDNQRCYYVEAPQPYEVGVQAPSIAGLRGKVNNSPEFQITVDQYAFHPFYHPFTRLFWNQLGAGGFDLLYDPNLQQVPDSIDNNDAFSFQNTYQPSGFVRWDLADASTTLVAAITSTNQTKISVENNIWVPVPAFYVMIGTEILQVTGVSNQTTWQVKRAQQGTAAATAPASAAVTPIQSSQDRQFLDFSTSATFSVYNWELFYHIPLYVAQLLSQNQQFEDAQTWFRYIFNPTRAGNDPIPGRFWIPKPLHDLTGNQILAQQINNLLLAVNQGDLASVKQVNSWRQNPFNPFLLADLRNGVPYMKSTVMSYLDNLIAWGDNLFATESREALSEATLIYVIASEMLGTAPTAITPPQHSDMSFDQLEPLLDAFANAWVEIENSVGSTAGSGNPPAANDGGMPPAHTFYFKIPSNSTLLAYWSTVADRLYKLRNCQNIAGAPLQLALFDAQIDPGLLIAAQASGVDLSSVLSNLSASLPNYRFTSLYPQALDFVNAVRAYGASLQAALEKTDAGALALLQQTTQQHLLSDGSQILDWQVQVAQSNIDSLNQALALAQQKYNFNTSQQWANPEESIALTLAAVSGLLNLVSGTQHMAASVIHVIPNFNFGVDGAGGTPTSTASDGGQSAGASTKEGADSTKKAADAVDVASKLATTIASYVRRQDTWDENAAEANIQITQTNAQLDGASLGLQIAQQNLAQHQEQIDNIQKQIDFLNNKFTSDSLYDWMVSSLSNTYFQSYQLAYQMCKQVERCYQFELGVQNSSFIQFGYWDSLYKGLLAGENLNQDLRRLQAAYLQQNARRFELSRYISLGAMSPAALQQLLVTGACDFTLSELLFDNDYPGHYNRRLTRVSLTVVYPNPGKFDNVKATLTLVSNQVRVSTDVTSTPYPENPVGSDPRFRYNYGAVPQKIAMGNAQDDPGLFLTSITNNIADQRYLPFENAGAISSWHLEMPQLNNEIDLSTVGDVILHLYYTALDGGSALNAAAQANNAANMPTAGVKIFSAQNDFVAPPASGANAKPVAPWQGFLYPPTAGGSQILTLQIFASKFPAWTRGKTITVTSLSVVALSWQPGPAGTLVLVPQAPLPTAPIVMTLVPGVSEPIVASATIPAPGTVPATWSFEIQQQGAGNFTSLTPDTIGDVLLFVNYQVN
jgi:hypothetical protein